MRPIASKSAVTAAAAVLLLTPSASASAPMSADRTSGDLTILTKDWWTSAWTTCCGPQHAITPHGTATPRPHQVG